MTRLLATIRRNIRPIMWACLVVNILLAWLNAGQLAYNLSDNTTTIGLIANVVGILASGLWLWRVKG